MTEPTLTERLQQAVDAARDAIKSRMCEYICPACEDIDAEITKRKEAEIDVAISRYGDLRALQGAWERRPRDPLNGIDTRHQTSAMHDDTCSACKLEAAIEAALKGADEPA